MAERPMTHTEWLQNARNAIGKGICPNDKVALDQHGVCSQCHSRWVVDGNDRVWEYFLQSHPIDMDL